VLINTAQRRRLYLQKQIDFLTDKNYEIMELNMKVVSIYIFYFFLYSAIGWFFESIYCSVPARKWINRGFLTGPMCPIYGTGALTLALFIEPISRKLIYISIFGSRVCVTPLLVFLAGMVLSDIVEFYTSLIMEKLFHAHWWDYSERFLNIQGRICFSHTLIWGGVSLAFIYLAHPVIKTAVTRIPMQIIYFILAVIAVVFIVDLVHAVHSAMDVKAFMDKFRRLNSRIVNASNTVIKSLESQIEIKVDGIHETTLKSVERFNQWKDDLTVQFNESLSKLKSENRLLKGFPNLSSAAKKQLQSIEELLQELKKRLFDDETANKQ
jgi:uncharacterized membrane protein